MIDVGQLDTTHSGGAAQLTLNVYFFERDQIFLAIVLRWILAI